MSTTDQEFAYQQARISHYLLSLFKYWAKCDLIPFHLSYVHICTAGLHLCLAYQSQPKRQLDLGRN